MQSPAGKRIIQWHVSDQGGQYDNCDKICQQHQTQDASHSNTTQPPRHIAWEHQAMQGNPVLVKVLGSILAV